MENDIVNLSLKKEEESIKPTQTISDVINVSEDVLRKYMTEKEIESIKQVMLYISAFDAWFKSFSEIVLESFDKISKLIKYVVECFNKTMLTTESLANAFPANNKLKMQGKPMRRFIGYAKIRKKK